MSLRMSEEDERLRRRVEGALRTVQAWEDPGLLLECRNSLDFEALGDPVGPYSRQPQDASCGRKNTQFVQRLCRYFQQNMTWVNNPPCERCGDTNTTQQTVRGPESDAEKQGQATRVEVYQCPTCQAATTTFPRFNNPKTLLKTKRGRCGEYANLFGLHCRAAGLSTRYILDVTDHVWVEVYVDGKWIMADGCEGVIDECSMYEAGWGKALTCMIAVATDHVIEVTPRYTRKFRDDDFMARRRAISSSEQAIEQVLRQINESLRQGMSSKARQQMETNFLAEEEVLRNMRQLDSWDTKESYGMGRISGSLAWKEARGEAGNKAADDDSRTQKPHPTHLHIETFYPPLQSSSATIAIQPTPLYRHEGILVNGAPCAVGEPDALSVVVIDNVHLGCVLQSRCFTALQDLCEFVDSLPEHRIVAMNGVLPNGKEVSDQCLTALSRLGGFDTNLLGEEFVFVGQVGACPDWTRCLSRKEPGFILKAQTTSSDNSPRLRTLRNTKPQRIVGRVPESVMPLQTQLLSNHSQKRRAFNCMKVFDDYVGYATRPGAPIYLLNATAFPLESVNTTDGDGDAWVTCIYLPAELVPDDDIGIQDEPASKNEKESPLYEVPVDLSFFSNSVGSQLLARNGGVSANLVDTAMALRNTRLVGFYFSAHWCGPCRSFTPMLAEMYEHLKGEYPAHGLELIFVSSDRDQNSFDNYYGSMPWAAIPFHALGTYKDLLSMTYGVRGIPSLVVLDAVSGQVVVSAQASRREVMQACSLGEDAIVALFENWLRRVPAESRELLDMLAVSCQCEATNVGGDESNVDSKLQSYLVRKAKSNSTKNDDMASKIKVKFTELVEQGFSPNEAAAKAITSVTSRNDTSSELTKLERGPLDGTFQEAEINEKSPQDFVIENGDVEDLKSVLSTVLKYVENAEREPWTPKFRSFKLSNKVADRIVRVPRGLELLFSLGLDVTSSSDDFFACIPLDVDLKKLHSEMENLLAKHSQY